MCFRGDHRAQLLKRFAFLRRSNSHMMVHALPLRFLDKVAGEIKNLSMSEFALGKVYAMHAKRKWSRRFILDRFPSVEAKVEHEGSGHFEKEIAVRRQGVERCVAPPAPWPTLCRFAAIMLFDAFQQLNRPFLLS